MLKLKTIKEMKQVFKRFKERYERGDWIEIMIEDFENELEKEICGEITEYGEG